MKVFKDRITGDELFSDIYDIKIVDDIVYEVSGKLTTEKLGVDCNTGGNPSAEGGDEDGGADEASKSGVDIILANRLEQAPAFTKATYKAYIKGFMKSIKNILVEEEPERVEAFTAGATKYIGALLKDSNRFKELDFYTGESMNGDGHHAILEWRETEGGEVPTLIFFKDGVVGEKV